MPWGGSRLPVYVLALGLGAGACRRTAEPPKEARPPLEAEIAGCAAIVEGPICELPSDRTIRVFVPGEGSVRASIDDRGVDATVLRAFPAGRLLRVVVPEGGKVLRVERDGKQRAIALAEAAHPWVLEARALRGKDPNAARARAAAFLASSDPDARALALGVVGRIELASGDVDAAIARLREAISIARARVSDRAEDGFALAFALSQRRGRYAEARAVLDEIAPSLASYPEGRARLPFYRAEVQLQEGDVRAVLQGLRAAHEAAARLGIVRLERNARGLLATVQQDLGDVDAGIETLRALDEELSADETATPCERAETLLNLVLTLDRRRETRRDLGEPPGVDDLSAPAARARALFPDGCKDPHLHGLALAGAAAAALARGAVDEARALADEAKTKLPSPRTSDVLESLWLDARIESARGDHGAARDRHASAIAIAEASHQTDMLWRALVGRGDALDALGERKTALAAYLRAESLLSDVTLAIPLGEARGAYLTRSEASARRVVSALLAAKDVGAALTVARRARARLLSVTARALAVDRLDATARASWDTAVARFREERAALDAAATADWKLASEALAVARAGRAAKIAALRAALDDAMGALGATLSSDAPLATPTPGELYLAFGRSREGFVAFAATAAAVRAIPVAASIELSAIAPEIRAAERVIVLAYGPFRGVDVHALPFEGAPLIDRLPVVYALDTPRVRAPVDGASLGVVADPTDDLPGARVEAKALEALYGPRGAEVRVLVGREASTTSITALLSGVGTFHYAGHGAFGGVDGEGSRLPLAGGSPFGVFDILAAPRVPRRVILSACESGRSSLDTLAETFGVAHAFVLAGSESVVAPTRKVEDALAARLAIELHAALLERPLDAPAALQRAQRAIRLADPTADWAAFRVLQP